ncbi:MAG: helix-turn-helix domain-containing protein [Longibaculum sp.]
MQYGTITMNIEKILKDKKISKNQICKDLNLSRYNFNKYCKNAFQRIDADFIAKLIYYLDITIDELITYTPPQD